MGVSRRFVSTFSTSSSVSVWAVSSPSIVSFFSSSVAVWCTSLVAVSFFSPPVAASLLPAWQRRLCFWQRWFVCLSVCLWTVPFAVMFV